MPGAPPGGRAWWLPLGAPWFATSKKMLAMRFFTCLLQLLAGLVLPQQVWTLSAGNSSSEVEVVPFQEVWSRSYCQALEKLVDVTSEFPSEVEYIFSPSCVPLLRCSGCCGDEGLSCVPVTKSNVTMQLLRFRPGEQPSYVELTFCQHASCECRRRPKVRGKRKREKQKPTDCHQCSYTVPGR
ncbi:placenta growth factor isoform X2 [Sorex fumeus]|uniref:placenta growth factor isoform X2 n=1 Tax=Sorex fumeus TaxID=62283 RepID=UPI0024AD4868|nr:placenta growth factor isoform X2 [Sorex fumeus]